MVFTALRFSFAPMPLCEINWLQVLLHRSEVFLKRWCAETSTTIIQQTRCVFVNEQSCKTRTSSVNSPHTGQNTCNSGIQWLGQLQNQTHSTSYTSPGCILSNNNGNSVTNRTRMRIITSRHDSFGETKLSLQDFDENRTTAVVTDSSIGLRLNECDSEFLRMSG